MTTLFMTAVEQWKKCIVFQIQKPAGSRYADIAYHVFSLEDPVAHLTVGEPRGILNIEKWGIKL